VDSGLTRKEIESFREMLLAKRAQLLGDVTSMQREAFSGNQRGGDLSSMPLHMADLGTDQYEQEFTLGLIEGEQALMREIDDAIQRIDNGTYGICLGTNQPIGKARLKAQPWAKYSYEYMLAQERGRNRRY
jgi:RNA polymerase-binding protein DksA